MRWGGEGRGGGGTESPEPGAESSARPARALHPHRGAASPGLVPTREGAAGRAPEERQPRAPCPGSPGPAPPPLGWEPLVAPLHVPAPRSPVSHLCPLFPGEVDGNVSESGSGLETITDSVDNSLLRENSPRGLRSASRGEQPGLCGLCGAGTKRSAPRPARRVPAPEPLWRSCPRRDLTRP